MTFNYGPPAPPWVQPAGAPPGHYQQTPGDGALARRFSNIGTWSLALGILELLYCGFRWLSAALTGSVLAFEQTMLGGSSAAGTTGAPLTKMMSTAEDFAGRIAVWDAIRALPFAVASCVLISIGVRLRRGERKALFAARTWVWCAFGVIVASVGLQVFVTIPMTLEYTRQLLGTMPKIPGAGPGSAPVDFGSMMDTWTLVSNGIGLLLGTLFLAAWPVVFRLWADRLIRDTTPLVG